MIGTGGGNFRPTLRSAVQKVEFRFAECSQKWLPSGVQQWLRPAGPVKIPQLRWQKTVPMPATGAFRLFSVCRSFLFIFSYLNIFLSIQEQGFAEGELGH